MFEYSVLRIIWWVLLGVLLSGFAIMDGFDLGVAALIPFLGKTDEEKRIIINTVGPVWEGNQVWIILGAGAIFAAWPTIYAVSFSGFYLAMFLLLTTFIIRPVAFKYRSKMPGIAWRRSWDYGLCFAGIFASIVFGVAIGNVLQGIPFHFDEMERAFYTGSFFALFNPFAVLCGLLSLFMLLMHGSVYLIIKTDGMVQLRARNTAFIFGALTILFFALGGLSIAHMNGYTLSAPVDINGPSNPLHKMVILTMGGWMKNYTQYHWMFAAPIFGFLGAFGVLVLRKTKLHTLLFIFSASSLFGIVTTVGVSMFPFLLPSSTAINESLIVWDASSSRTTLEIMLFCAVVFIPIILAYTSWVFWVLRGKVTSHTINKNDQSY